ncbi:11171_t:CDS:2, partial [Acaulospora morrowiae]
MSSLLGLNYYDDEDDEPHSDKEGVTTKQHNNVAGVTLSTKIFRLKTKVKIKKKQEETLGLVELSLL